MVEREAQEEVAVAVEETLELEVWRVEVGSLSLGELANSGNDKLERRLQWGLRVDDDKSLGGRLRQRKRLRRCVQVDDSLGEQKRCQRRVHVDLDDDSLGERKRRQRRVHIDLDDDSLRERKRLQHRVHVDDDCLDQLLQVAEAERRRRQVALADTRWRRRSRRRQAATPIRRNRG